MDAPQVEDPAEAGQAAARGKGTLALGSNGRKAIFIDRDGTLIEEVGYLNHLSRMRLLPGSARAVRRINESGYLALVVTNQSGIARKIFDVELLESVHAALAAHLAESGARLDGIYHCPHHPDALDPRFRRDCDCRKPKPGMFLSAAREHGLDLSRSWMIGDSSTDMAAARNAGVRFVLVLTGYGRGEVDFRVAASARAPDHVAEDLGAAVDWILNRAEAAA